jgi:hypothetical protein
MGKLMNPFTEIKDLDKVEKEKEKPAINYKKLFDVEKEKSQSESEFKPLNISCNFTKFS